MHCLKPTVTPSAQALSVLSHCLLLQVVGQTFQNLESVSPRTYIGSGKTLEVEGAVDELEADTVIFDDELTPGQLRNLERVWGDKIRLCDRTALILDIFSQRAATKEGQLQVHWQLSVSACVLHPSFFVFCNLSMYCMTRHELRFVPTMCIRFITFQQQHLNPQLLSLQYICWPPVCCLMLLPNAQSIYLYLAGNRGTPMPILSFKLLNTTCLQVELAQSEYQLPRLTRMWTHLERQAGGRVRGMGEKQIEVDKRILRTRMGQLRRSLEDVRTHRKQYRERRAEVGFVKLFAYHIDTHVYMPKPCRILAAVRALYC